MIIRKSKTILILYLCIAISFTSNAAVSVSDGSAFITSAEFSSDINNLENRLAYLENSMDAKIDSMVSSYLTRNGIWNGAKQELSDAVKEGNEYYFNCTFTTGDRGTKTDSIVKFSDVIVPKTSKAGMAFGSFVYGNKHRGSPNHWYYGLYATGAGGWIWDHNMCITLSFYESEQSVTTATAGSLKSVVEIGKSIGMRNWDPGGLILLAIPLPAWNVIPFMFFVEKDKKIWWRWLDECSTWNMTGTKVYSAYDSAISVRLNDFSIY